MPPRAAGAAPFLVGLAAASLVACGSGASPADRIDAALQRARADGSVGRVLAGMPLGGDLHHHFSGGAWAEELITIGAARGLCVDPDDGYRSSDPPCGDRVRLAAALDNRELHDAIVRAWSMAGRSPGDDGAAAHFFSIFGRIPAVIRDVGGVVTALRRRAARERISYLESMLEWPPATAAVDRLADGLDPLDLEAPDAAIRLRRALLADPRFVAARDEAVATLDGALLDSDQRLGCDADEEAPGCAVVVRFVHFVLREAPLARVLARAVLAFEVAAASPVVVGVDIVGPETGAGARADYRHHMRAFGSLGALHPGVGRSLHAGEIAPGPLEDDLADHVGLALAASADGGAAAQRIGHAVSLYDEPAAVAALEIARQRPAVLAINLRSNALLLGVTHDRHPLARLTEASVPLVLSSDDPGIFRSGLGEQFALAAGEHGLDYRTLRRLARNSLAFAFVDADTKTRLRARFEVDLARWEADFSDPASAADASR